VGVNTLNKRFEWPLLIFLAAAGIFLWYRFALARYQSIDLNINQARAVVLADQFLKTQRGVDTHALKSVAVFNVDEDADRYLEKTLGIASSQKLLKGLHYDLFSWVVRFFKEKQKEEFRVVVSSATGQITGFSHIIEDTASRPAVDKDKARQHAVSFLETTFGFDPPGISFTVRMLKSWTTVWNMPLVGRPAMWMSLGIKPKSRAMPNF